MRRKRRQQAAEAHPSPSFQHPKRAYPPLNILSAEEEEHVHASSLRLLHETGLKFLLPDAWFILEKQGCLVDTESGVVRFPPDVLEHWLNLAPSEFQILARDPAKTLNIGGDAIYYGSASSAPNVMDLDGGRRPGTRDDFQALVRLNHSLGSCGFFSGHPVEPIDAPPHTRHLSSTYDWLTLSDKVFRVYCIGATRVRDALAMIEIAHGIDRATLQATPRLHTGFNVNSPLLLDAPLLAGAMEMARNCQVVVVSPVAFSGAMSPISLSGSVIQCNAETIGMVAFLQMVQAGTPCFYGTLSTPVDMKSGAPAMGTPESVTGTLANGQMARRYGLPHRATLGSTSNSVDAQSAYESMFSLWSAQLSGAHIVYHAHGWMEGGLTASFEKTILDADLVQMMGALAPRIDFSDTDEALSAIAKAGPGGHFLGSDHTMSRYKTAFYRPILSDWRPFEFWQTAGAPDTQQRANKVWKDLLEAYEPPPIDPGIRETLDAYVTRRSRELEGEEI